LQQKSIIGAIFIIMVFSFQLTKSTEKIKQNSNQLSVYLSMETSENKISAT